MVQDPRSWKQQYDRDGYVVVEDVLDSGMLESLRSGIDAIIANEALPPHLALHVQRERDFLKSKPQYNELSGDQVGKAVRNIMELPLLDRRFADLILYQPLLDILAALFESTEFHFHNYKCILKSPRVSSAFQWHRDLPYLKHSTPNLITAILCLDPMTEENGATVVLPGSHRIPYEQVVDADRDIPADALPKEFERRTVLCPAGSAVLFHVNNIHGGGPNRSAIPRRNVISIWAGPDTYPTTAARYAYQGIYPLSKDPAKQRQTRLTFPHLFSTPSHSPVGR